MDKKLDKLKGQLNSNEKIYYDYYLTRNDDELLCEFIKNLDIEYVKSNNLFIPDIRETIPEIVDDVIYMAVDDSRDIGAIIHDRYTPAFTHFHKFIELLYVYSGACTVNIGMSSVNLKEGDVCMISPEIGHSLEVFDNSIVFKTLIRNGALELITSNLFHETSLISDYISSIANSNKIFDYIVFHTGDNNQLRGLFLSILEESINKDKYHEQIITNSTMIVFGYLARYYENTAELPNLKTVKDMNRYKIIKMIQDNFKDITLDDIAAEMNYTREYTSRYIKKITGKNFTEILKSLRLEESKRMLLNSNMTVMDISESVGFNSIEYYLRSFKLEYGVTPSQYRKNKD